MDPKQLKEYFASEFDIQLSDEQAVAIADELKKMPPQHRDGKAVFDLIKKANMDVLNENIGKKDPRKIKQALNRLDNDIRTSVDTGPIDDILDQIKKPK